MDVMVESIIGSSLQAHFIITLFAGTLLVTICAYWTSNSRRHLFFSLATLILTPPNEQQILHDLVLHAILFGRILQEFYSVLDLLRVIVGRKTFAEGSSDPVTQCIARGFGILNST